MKMIIWVTGVLRRTVVGDLSFDNLYRCHLQSHVIDFSQLKIQNTGERFNWSIDRVAAGKLVILLAVETNATEMGFVN